MKNGKLFVLKFNSIFFKICNYFVRHFCKYTIVDLKISQVFLNRNGRKLENSGRVLSKTSYKQIKIALRKYDRTCDGEEATCSARRKHAKRPMSQIENG